MLLNLVLLLLAIAIVLVVTVVRRPAAFRIVRTATVAAPPEAVFAEVNDFRRWRAWSPYEKLDPDMQRTYEGAPEGVGAAYGWSGDRRIGAGRCTISDSRPNDRIAIKLEMFRPFAATNAVEFTFRAEGRQTVVTWAMTGRCNFASKAFSLFMNMDKMVGGQFEQGLAGLKAVAEAAAGR